MKLKPENIIQAIRNSHDKSMSGRQIMTALNLPAGARRILHRQLRELERQRLLKRLRGGRYALARSAEVLEGVISTNRRGGGSIQLVNGESVRISTHQLAGAGDGDRVRFSTMRRDRANQLNGRVMEILERSGKLAVGVWQRGRDEDFVLPVDSSFSQPIIIDRSSLPDPNPGDWVVVKPQVKPAKEGSVRGELLDILGNPADPTVEMMAIACRFSIPLHFPAEVIAEAEQIEEEVVSVDLSGRKDLRELPFVTIDGETARDFDDAVTVRVEGDNVRLFVAIADVSHYVPISGAIDNAALERGTSVYFPGYCIPMLPEILSNEICSLKPEVDRLVLVAEILFSQTGRRIESLFYPAVIRSQARLTYNEVQDHLDQSDPLKKPTASGYLGQLPLMLEISTNLTRLRMERGSLDFEIPEPMMALDSDGRPEMLHSLARLPAHRIVEEFMLAANEAVAEYLACKDFDLLYRIHETPDPSDFSVLNNYLTTQALPKLTFKHDLHPDMQRLIDSVEEPAERKIISRLLLRSMKQARYSIKNEGHYGLAAESYCHFTSPIRRYPDLVIHRLLKQCLKNNKSTIDKNRLTKLAEQSSHRERLAVNAERDVLAMLTCRFMENKIGANFSGVISSVQKFGFFVELHDFPVEGLVHIASLGDDYFRFEAETGRLVGTEKGQIYSIGMPVKILLKNVNIARREIDFTLRAGQGKVKQKPPFRRRRRR